MNGIVNLRFQSIIVLMEDVEAINSRRPFICLINLAPTHLLIRLRLVKPALLSLAG